MEQNKTFSLTELAENSGQPGTKFQACKFGIVGKLNLCTITEKKPPSVHFGEKKLQGLEEGELYGHLIVFYQVIWGSILKLSWLPVTSVSMGLN